MLADVVANVLETLGFSVRVYDKVPTKADTLVKVNVLGEKLVGVLLEEAKNKLGTSHEFVSRPYNGLKGWEIL
jgi:hypothetical protein